MYYVKSINYCLSGKYIPTNDNAGKTVNSGLSSSSLKVSCRLEPAFLFHVQRGRPYELHLDRLPAAGFVPTPRNVRAEYPARDPSL
jgi:hypothetical protein